MVEIKKSAHPRLLPGVHPGLEQRLREAEQAELRGETPRQIDGPQKVLRPTPDASAPERKAQAQALGLVEPAYRTTSDGLAALAEQAPFMPGIDLDTVWDNLSEQEKIRAGAIERFRLEMDTSLRLAAMPWEAPHRLGGRLDQRAMQRSTRNLRAEISAFAYLLAPDSRTLLERFVDETEKLLALCARQRALEGIDALPLHELLRDLVHKLIYQELASRRRAMGDRGIRRICANIELAEQVYAQLRALPDFSPRERLLMRIIHVHQDLGHTAYAARVSYRGSKLHRAYGARIFNDELQRYRPLLHQEELELVRAAIATHSAEELPFNEARVLALVRAVDHLAPFAPHRVYDHLAAEPELVDYLDDLLERAGKQNYDGYLVAKEAFRVALSDTAWPPALRDDLWAAFRPVERLADLVDLGELAGQVSALHFVRQGSGELVATLAPSPFAQRYQALFDAQQDQLRRLARVTGVSEEALRQSPRLSFQAPGAGTLTLVRG
ncbi:MAG: hypothetical protein V1750_08405 [Acidobacteriota bacterium]